MDIEEEPEMEPTEESGLLARDELAREREVRRSWGRRR